MTTATEKLSKQDALYQGKAKTLYTTSDPARLIMEFRDDTSRFDGEKIEALANKGETNNRFNAFIMELLSENGVPCHFESLASNTESVVKHLNMLPIECVVRNICAGSICRRMGLEEGLDLEKPLFEFFFKDDEHHDPMINESHIEVFGWATKEQVEEMKRLTFMVNEILRPRFLAADMLLVDFKLEFGMYEGQLLLGDEFTPDGCRVWDKNTRQKLDKDRFRQDLGDVVESYQIVAKRLGVE